MYIRKYVIMYNKINDNVFGKTLSSVSVTIAEFADLHLPPFYSSTCRGVCTLETTAVLFSSHEEDKVTTSEPPLPVPTTQMLSCRREMLGLQQHVHRQDVFEVRTARRYLE